MKIESVGPGRGVVVRTVLDWVWRPENGYLCDVGDAEVAANLLTMAGGEFATAKGETMRLVEMDGGWGFEGEAGERQIGGEHET